MAMLWDTANMSTGRDVEDESRPEGSGCLARSVVEALSQEPALEAVTVNRAQQTISVATIGQADVPQLTARISASFLKAREVEPEPHCQLLKGRGECRACPRPLSDAERRNIIIRHEADATTIARVTCPTAPTFWRWRAIPWPKVVPRDVEFLEHPGEID